MKETAPTVERLAPEVLRLYLPDLCRVLIDSVRDGAAISFLAPLSHADAVAFWERTVKAAVAAGERHLFGAILDQRLVGTVQLVVGMPPNQAHRAEISKMIVHPDVRRRGVASALMRHALDIAAESGKSLVTLDTRTGDAAEALYRSLGFAPAGTIPGYAVDPDGITPHATTYMYKRLNPPG